MSWEATGRAWQSGATGNDLLVLLALADHAGGEDDPFGHAYPSIGRLETMTGLSRRTVQRALRTLEDEGLIEATGEHVWNPRKVTTVYRLAEGRRGDTPGEPRGVNRAAEGRRGDAQTSPSTTPKEQSVARDPREAVPEDFPDELRPHAREVMRILVEVAQQHGAKKVWPLALGRLLMANRTKPLVATAHELHVWAVDPPRPIKDVVATYRTFLGRAPTLQGVEPLGARGPMPENVHRMPRRGSGLEERTARRLAELEALEGEAGHGSA